MIKSYQKNGKTLYEVYVAERDKSKKIIARRKRGITSERQAREVEFQFKVELDTLSKSDRLWTWEKWHEECLRRMKMVLKNSTILNYEGRVKRWAPEEWKLKEIKSFTTNDILDVLEKIQSSEKRISPKYFLKLLRRLFQMAVEEGIIEKNPTAFIKLKESRKIQKVLNSKEAEILLQKAQETGHRFFPIWTVAVKTGMRSGEMYALKWTDIDFENDLIKVNKQWTSKDGITQTKTGDYRVVPISSDLRKFLLELKALRGQEESVLPHLRQWTNGEQAIVLKEFCKS
jgi:integrase